MVNRTQIGVVPFGRYRLVEQLGSGGMAAVFRAFLDGPQGFERSLVVKRILPELCRNPKFVKMLIAEARLNALLHHPGIVQVLDFGEVDGEYFLAMEYIDGYDLSTLQQQCARLRQPLPPAVACHLAHEVAAALAYVHGLRDAAGAPLDIIHRDVSPSNIMVGKTGVAKLLDFGIAKAATALRDDKTKTGTIKGKLGYMSPEQIDGAPIDRRADIFALGVVLHECLTMKRLFRGHNDLHTIRLVRDARVVPPSRCGAASDDEIDAVVMRMLARSPDERFADCDAVVAALTPIVRRLNGDAAATREWLAALGPIAGAAPAPAPSGSGEPSSFARSPSPLTPSLGAAESPTTPTRSYGELQAGAGRMRGSYRQAVVAVAGAGAIVAALALLLGGPWRAPAHAPAVAPSPSPPAPAPAAPLAPQPSPPAAPLAPQPSPPAAPLAPQPSPPASAALAAPSPATPTATRERPRTVRLYVSGPAGARVSLDGRAAGALPLDLTLPARDNKRVIVVQRAGAARWVKTIGGGEDVSLTVPASHKAALNKPRESRETKPRDDGETRKKGLFDPFAR
jgi:serine/threonine protein kinase